MKKFRFISIALIGAFALLAVACVKEISSNEELYRPKGTPISFSAEAVYDNGVETRAEYSGQLYGSTTRYERINWENGDKIRIVYANRNDIGNFAVNGNPTNTNEYSLASVSGSDSFWWTTGDHVFKALYPSDHSNGETGTTTGEFEIDGTVRGTIPAAQNVTSTTKTITATEGNVSYTKYQPNTQEYGYLVAWKTISSTSTESSVVLPFRPAVTTFEFKFQRLGTTANSRIESFVMSTQAVNGTTTPLTGMFRFTLTGGDERGATWNKTVTTDNTGTKLSNTGNTITVQFPQGGVSIPSATDGGYLDFSILALPIDLTGVSLTINFVGGTSKTLKLQDSRTPGSEVWHTFTGAKKYIITNTSIPGSDSWHYVVDEIDDIVTYGHTTVSGLPYNVKSYRWNDREGSSVKYAVKWKTQYTTDGGTTWTDLPAGGYVKDAYTTFSVNTLTGDGVGTSSYSTGENRSANIIGTSNATITGDPSAGAAIRALLATRTARGNEVGVGSGPFDLSKHPTYGAIDTEGSQNTANSYVVFAPGVYMFPCVYGNAIKGGNDNKSSYWPSSADHTTRDAISGESFSTLSGVNTNYNTNNFVQHYYTPRFYNALNQPITTPYIKNDLNASGLEAIVLWQDTYVNDEIIPYTSGYIGMTTVNGVDYIWFKVDREHIQPGNLVIALKGSAGNLSDEILWSWHIWVTEKDLTPSDEVVNSAGTYHLMPYNLGWVDTVDGSVEKWDDRSIEYRIVQTDSNGNELPIGDTTGDDSMFTVTQIGEAITVQTSIGANPYYQWGRKDPQIPAIPINYNATQFDCTSRQVSPNPDYNIPTDGALVPAQAVSTTIMDYATGIKLPYVPLSNIEANNGRTVTGWVGGTIYPYSLPSGYYMLTKEDRGPFLLSQATNCNLAGLTVPTFDCWRQEVGTGPGGQDLWYIRDDYPYNFGPYTTTQRDYLLAIDQSAHFASSDFITNNTADQRSKSGNPYNLWNSYIYAETTQARSDVNKFKTVYDPCPPGFTVPCKQVFIGTNQPTINPNNTSTKQASPTWTVSSRETATVFLNGQPQTKTIGVNFSVGGSNTIFMPFTGSRVFYHNNGNPNLQAEWAGGMGFYWTDNPYGIDWLNSDHSHPELIGSFWWFHSAYSFSFAYPSFTSQTYTKGSAFSIRPMVDPKY